MNRITTHILNTSNGKPAADIDVQLLVQRETIWETLGKGQTDTDGRTGFIPADTDGPLRRETTKSDSSLNSTSRNRE